MKGQLVIEQDSIYRLRNQGTMIHQRVVDGYLYTLTREFYNKGVRCAPGTLLTVPSWEFYRNFGSHFATYTKEDKLIFFPIFSGHVHSGHFSLLVVDRITYSGGLFLYFDSYKQGSPALARRVKDAISSTSMWEEGKSVFQHVQHMPFQARGTNDCGIFTPVLAAEYLEYLRHSGGFNREDDTQLIPAQTTMILAKVECMCDIAQWGRYGRHHIERSIRKGTIDWKDSALHFMKLEIYAGNLTTSDLVK
jgi:hypothetical protein